MHVLLVKTSSLGDVVHNLPMAINGLNPEDEVIVYCHTGVRSFHVGKFLEHNGFKNVANLRGGIEAWAREVDKTMARY